ncbi:MAG: RNA polymerase sigma factor [Actinomycetota bacterium]|nr:RNA polymerase sigma factor [Actinomycetota bacterium]
MRRPSAHREKASFEKVSAEVVERCKNGDERAWAELVDATYRDVYTLCLRILGDPHDAAEATQDAYLKAWRGLKSFRGDAMFETWLYRVASNSALSKHRGRGRRQGREAVMEDEALMQLPASGSVEETAGARVEVQRLEAALATLPEQHRTAVVLRDVYGMTIQEIAKQLGISETAAKVRVHRARKRLRDLVFEGDER